MAALICASLFAVRRRENQWHLQQKDNWALTGELSGRSSTVPRVEVKKLLNQRIRENRRTSINETVPDMTITHGN